MILRKAEEKEAAEILTLYRSVTGSPFCVWNEFYPGEEEITADLGAGTLFDLDRDGEIIGAVSIVPENEMDDFDCWEVRENAREFARVVIHPAYQGKGLSANLIEGITERLREYSCSAVHISVAVQNIPAQKLYAGQGFAIRGEDEMYGNSYFLCEKIL